MVHLINKILLEANLERDLEQKRYVNDFFKKIDNIISNYTKNNDIIIYDPKTKIVSIDLDNIKIEFIGQDSESEIAKKLRQLGGAGGYDSGDNIVYLFARIKYDGFLSKELSVRYDKSSLYHELIHLFDFRRTKDPTKVADRIEKNYLKNGLKSYYNNPYEYNAHFLQNVMPEVEEYIKNLKSLPKSYKEFKNRLLNSVSLETYYVNLDDKFKGKFEKRLENIYQELIKRKNAYRSNS